MANSKYKNMRERESSDLTWSIGWHEGKISAYERVINRLKDTPSLVAYCDYLAEHIAAHKAKLEKLWATKEFRP